MPLTPLSSATPYCTAGQLAKRYDVRTFGDLILDNGQRASPEDMLDPTTIAGANLLEILLEASGKVERAAMVGLRYQPADLQGLIAAGPSAGASMLAGIVADLTVYGIYKRRPSRMKDMPVEARMAMEDLRDLAEGNRIFAFLEAGQAGLPDDGGDNISDVETRNGTTYQLNDYLGRRSNRVPPQDI